MPERPGHAPGIQSYADAPPIAAGAAYAYRRSAFEQERTYALDDTSLWVLEEGKPAVQVPFTAIRAVWLDDARGRNVRHFECTVKTAHGYAVNLRHQSYRGFADFEDRRGAYTPFVREMLTRLAAYDHVRFRAGSPIRFWTGIPMIFLVLGMAVLMWSIGAKSVTWVSLFGAVVMLVHTLAARPRDISPLAPPSWLLPA